MKRFLQHIGETLDEWDETFDNFHEQINPDTADEIWIDWWMYSLFGWSWYPSWFTLENKRKLYRNMARHIARRGTKLGIELWLRDFDIVAQVHTRPDVWGEFVWGETQFSVSEPLNLVIEILSLPEQYAGDEASWGESVWGEFIYTEPKAKLTEREIIELIRYMSPLSQEVFIAWRTHENIV